MTRRFEQLTWLPVPVLLVIGLLYLVEPQFVYDSQSLLLMLNFLFLTVPFGLIAALLARNFLARPILGLLLFGCGSLLWCGASIFSPLAMGQGPNAVITIYNLLVSISAFCHLAGAVLAQMPKRNVSRANAAADRDVGRLKQEEPIFTSFRYLVWITKVDRNELCYRWRFQY